MEGYMPGTECALCRGKCCKEKGCSLSPQDMWQKLAGEKGNDTEAFLQDSAEVMANVKEHEAQLREQILSLLKRPENLFAIDYFSSREGTVFYLRMRHKCYTFIGIDAMGECAALTENGCSLLPQERPKGGRFLKSAADGNCVQHYTREMMQKDWAPYGAVLKSIFTEYEKKMREDGTFERCDTDYFAWMRRQREGEK